MHSSTPRSGLRNGGGTDSLDDAVRALVERGGSDADVAARACACIEAVAIAEAGPRGASAGDATLQMLERAAPAVVVAMRAHRNRALRVVACRALAAAIYAGGEPVASAAADGFTARGRGLAPLLGMIRQTSTADSGKRKPGGADDGAEAAENPGAVARVAACGLLLALSAHAKRSDPIVEFLKPAMPRALDSLLSASVPETPSLPSHRGFVGR